MAALSSAYSCLSIMLGIEGDPSKPLSEDPNDPLLIDPDNDGNPGVTVDINIGNVIKGEIYITRREIYTKLFNHKSRWLYNRIRKR